jgi:putative transposase
MPSDKFKNRYRISSSRLPHWNYGGRSFYFITICTQDRICYFGEIVNDKITYTEIGNMVDSEWQKTFELRKDMNLVLDEFIVMPNHFHAIIGIGENEFNSRRDTMPSHRDAMHGVSTDKNHTLVYSNQFGPQHKNLSSIVRGFRSSVSTFARKNNVPFKWQERFHDHIIRNAEEYHRIRQYIAANLKNWKEDALYFQAR